MYAAHMDQQPTNTAVSPKLVEIFGSEQEAQSFLSKHKSWIAEMHDTFSLAQGEHAFVWHPAYHEYVAQGGTIPNWPAYFTTYKREHLTRGTHTPAAATPLTGNEQHPATPQSTGTVPTSAVPSTLPGTRAPDNVVKRSKHPELAGLSGKEYARAYMRIKRGSVMTRDQEIKAIEKQIASLQERLMKLKLEKLDG